MATITRYKRRPKGTWMRLRSADLLRALVGPEEDKVMSGRKLARYAETHPSFIDHLLSGRRSSCSPKTADRIAEALGVSTALLFDEQVSTTKQLSVNEKAGSAA